MKTSPAKPHFFKPILPGFKNGLKIPIYFSKSILATTTKHFSGKALLRKKGNEWRVDVINGHFVGHGWRRFAEENNLEIGDFVVFEHHGNLVFDATVFDRVTHCKKEHHRDGARRPSMKSKFEEEISSESDDDDDEEEEEEADDDSNDRPHFIARITDSNTDYGFLHVPKAFARSNGLMTMGQKRKIIVKDEQERSWHFCLSTSADGNNTHIRRGSTMAEFFAANGFKNGDSFKLEVVAAGVVSVVKILSHQSNDCPYNVFTSTIKPYSLGRCLCLIIPMKFAMRNGLYEKQRMILENERGRSWEVKLRFWQNRLGICGGWKKFTDENGIKKGDAFKFEIVENGDVPVVRFIVADG